MRLDLDFLQEPFLQFGQGEAKLPKDGLTELARYVVSTPLDLEDRAQRETVVWRLGRTVS